jgi:hypothetical protein
VRGWQHNGRRGRRLRGSGRPPGTRLSLQRLLLLLQLQQPVRELPQLARNVQPYAGVCQGVHAAAKQPHQQLLLAGAARAWGPGETSG